ncbi:MAG: type II toxin-antitoxin system RelE/ParE family toxin [Sphingomonadales bacterium]|nr:MAG: type II toxin-antitoxin system RelE/ParE family toxin [Sphingomonadales bacterium]TNF04142.1 MAG: type II toxin-antitoxin system RelE/ParE family toxin [Sphingomonadales bacterium]
MTAKPVIPRAKARADVDLAVEYYANEADVDVAFGFIDALEHAYTFIGEMPGAGSPRWSHELNLPGLRTIRLKGFPWLVFYLEFETHVDVWRVLHAKRDMPTGLADGDD